MINYKLTIEYDGENYFGWQRQKNTGRTIQESIENALQTILGKEVRITGAGRTDTGVHSFNQTANFKIEHKLSRDRFLYSLNSILPKDILIKNIKKVSPEFHSRYSAKMREYIYKITLRDKAIERYYFYRFIYDLDFNILDEFIAFLKSNKYFKSLCKNKSDKHNFKCNIDYIGYKYNRKKEEIIFKIRADRFLHSMVRAITGCAMDLARKRLNLEETILKISKGEKIKANYLPGNALFLNKIYY
ncbi:MAG: tRNA pseudouridine(38-40) synthase TruA [Ignavibacteria bacterium]|nr:tRNA pseudouridine(38-40) synthase TruA [Ignavibacteria bacterium]